MGIFSAILDRLRGHRRVDTTPSSAKQTNQAPLPHQAAAGSQAVTSANAQKGLETTAVQNRR